MPGGGLVLDAGQAAAPPGLRPRQTPAIRSAIGSRDLSGAYRGLSGTRQPDRIVSKSVWPSGAQLGGAKCHFGAA